ncbi:MAG TPA: hypothetical protein VM580_33565 [Labilithrix sp.]|nr:hypothetical protein [Labilithrix sp.]
MTFTRLSLLVAFSATTLLAFPGCATDIEPSEDDAAGVSEDALSTDQGGWKHQAGFNLSCTDSVKNTFHVTYRHYYSFAGSVANDTSFTLNGTWPASWGARIVVKDLAGKVIGQATNPKASSVSLSVTFPSNAKYFVYVSPANYLLKMLFPKSSYTLAASCKSNGSCLQDTDCQQGQSCSTPVCIKAPCEAPGVCVDATPFCAEYTTTDNRFYAKNFTNHAEAEAWTQNDPLVDAVNIREGHCNAPRPCPKIYLPVCGTPISTDQATTFGNQCAFQNSVRAAAGKTGESKGTWRKGACPAVDVDFCATVKFESDGRQYVYASNHDSKAEAFAWIDTFTESNKVGTVTSGPCDAPTACAKIYWPVCGVIGTGGKHTYSNACMFAAAIKNDAGDEAPGFSKGYSVPGACTCDYNDPARSYLIQDAEACKAAKFGCAEGKSHFFDECGCGCE